MCGIAGIVDAAASAEAGVRAATVMADLLAHRGPDDAGTWADAEGGVFLAHRRLSIIDLSPAGCQPMTSLCGRYVIVFNGEIYNHLEIRRRLDAVAARNWRGHCDTETLLEAIAQWGCLDALRQTAGMFAFAVWDKAQRTLHLARDRFGEKPLYFGRVGSAFAFTSELKAFRALPGWRPEIDRRALTEMMRKGYVPAPLSIFRGIRKLGPGEVLTLRSMSSEPRIDTYWSARAAAEFGRDHTFRGSREDAVERCELMLSSAVAAQMLSDVSLGAFLSGGIDSSAIVALMQAAATRPVRTFTIGFRDSAYDEAAYARAVAKHLGTDHTEHYVSGEEARDVVARLPSIYCEPFADASQIPTYLISRLARAHVTVALTGDAGDEVFSGYRRYAFDSATLRRLGRVPRPLRAAAATLASSIPTHVYDRAASAMAPVLPAALAGPGLGDKITKASSLFTFQDAEDAYRRLTSQWLDAEDVVVGAAGLSPLRSLAPVFDDNVRAMMFRDLTGYLPDDILVKVDRAAMAAGLETRVPMLDHRLVEFTFELPLSILRADGHSKWPLRQILNRHVPADLIDRPKAGFAVPIGDWLRGPLRDWAEALLSSVRLRREGYLNPTPVRRAWEQHVAGRGNHEHRLWNVLMFQAWLEAQHATEF